MKCVWWARFVLSGKQVFGGLWLLLFWRSHPAGAEFLKGSTRLLRADSVLEHKELYAVQLHFDIQDMNASSGLTMHFDTKENGLRLVLGTDPMEGLAWGTYFDKIKSTGWSELSVDTSKDVANDIQAYAAGFIEGVLTSVRLSEFHANVRALLQKEADSEVVGSVRMHLRKQLAYLKASAHLDGMRIAEEPEDTYWKQVRYTFVQLWGICDGYNKVAHVFQVRELNIEDLLLLNVGGELPQLLEAFSPDAVAQRTKVAREEVQLLQLRSRTREARPASRVADPLDEGHWERRVIRDGKCSALVRLADGNSDIFVGHTTWDDYSKMTRIFKYYSFHYANADSVASKIGFSSYPGLISSTDDFYILDSGLTVTETSLVMLDSNVWSAVPEKTTIPTCFHLMAVNRMARSAPDWARRLMSSKIGTYNAQWMVVDYNQFEPGKTLQENTFWTVETVPGASHAQDMTPYLRKHGFFASFNRPFFEVTRKITGHKAAEASHGELYSWSENPRAKLFKAEATSVNVPGAMRSLMSQNLYPSLGTSPGHEISARMDLLAADATPNGGIDAKITSRCLRQSMSVQAISGPSHQTLPPFRWSEAQSKTELWPGFPHIGLPEEWNFDFVQLSPAGQGPLQDGSATAC